MWGGLVFQAMNYSNTMLAAHLTASPPSPPPHHLWILWGGGCIVGL
jgi:hypothetical protein